MKHLIHYTYPQNFLHYLIGRGNPEFGPDLFWASDDGKSRLTLRTLDEAKEIIRTYAKQLETLNRNGRLHCDVADMINHLMIIGVLESGDHVTVAIPKFTYPEVRDISKPKESETTLRDELLKIRRVCADPEKVSRAAFKLLCRHTKADLIVDDSYRDQISNMITDLLKKHVGNYDNDDNRFYTGVEIITRNVKTYLGQAAAKAASPDIGDEVSETGVPYQDISMPPMPLQDTSIGNAVCVRNWLPDHISKKADGPITLKASDLRLLLKGGLPLTDVVAHTSADDFVINYCVDLMVRFVNTYSHTITDQPDEVNVNSNWDDIAATVRDIRAAHGESSPTHWDVAKIREARDPGICLSDRCGGIGAITEITPDDETLVEDISMPKLPKDGSTDEHEINIWMKHHGFDRTIVTDYTVDNVRRILCGDPVHLRSGGGDQMVLRVCRGVMIQYILLNAEKAGITFPASDLATGYDMLASLMRKIREALILSRY